MGLRDWLGSTSLLPERRDTPTSGLNDPSVPLYQALTGALDGISVGAGGSSLPGVTLETATRLTAVYRSVYLLANLGTIPLKVLKPATTPSGRRISIEDDVPQWDVLTRAPNREMDASEMYSITTAHMALAGNAFLYSPNGPTVSELHILPRPDRVKVGRDPETGTKIYVVPQANGDDFVDVGLRDGGSIVHIRNLGLDGLVGLSVIKQARRAFGLVGAAEQYGEALFTNGSYPGGLLTSDQELTPEEARDYARGWERWHRGANRAHRVAVFGKGLRYQPISISPEDAQFLETRRFQVAEIARLFGVPPHLLADASGSTSWGSGLEEQNRAFVAFTLAGYATRIERAIQLAMLPRGYSARFKFEGFLRPNSLQRAQFYQLGRNAGWLSINDIRTFEDMPDIGPNGDEYLEPMNMRPAGPPAAAELSEVEKINAAVALIGAGFDHEAALAAVGLDPIAISDAGNDAIASAMARAALGTRKVVERDEFGRVLALRSEVSA